MFEYDVFLIEFIFNINKYVVIVFEAYSYFFESSFRCFVVRVCCLFDVVFEWNVVDVRKFI